MWVTLVVPDYLEFVDCTFTGRITGLRFWGRPLDGASHYGRVFNAQRRAGALPVLPGYREIVLRERNQIHGNDFSGARLVKVEFRFGVDLTAQKLPVGENYFYVADPETTVPRGLRAQGRRARLHRPRRQRPVPRPVLNPHHTSTVRTTAQAGGPTVSIMPLTLSTRPLAVVPLKLWRATTSAAAHSPWARPPRTSRTPPTARFRQETLLLLSAAKLST